VRYEGLSVEKSGPPPLPGEHMSMILAELGYNRADIEKLSKPSACEKGQGKTLEPGWPIE
jgi:crotonobetainyl-CoA:carnitine CoA-transferase CaiB-like acyl-CoA transferase